MTLLKRTRPTHQETLTQAGTAVVVKVGKPKTLAMSRALLRRGHRPSSNTAEPKRSLRQYHLKESKSERRAPLTFLLLQGVKGSKMLAWNTNSEQNDPKDDWRQSKHSSCQTNAKEDL